MYRRNVLAWLAVVGAAVRQLVTGRFSLADDSTVDLSQNGRQTKGENAVKKLQFSKHPMLRLGITTQNFIECVPVTFENVKAFIDYSVQQGFSFMELRDPSAVLTPDECRRLNELAKQAGVAIAYTNQRGLLDSDFWEVFNKGIANAVLFDGTRTIRVLAANELFTNDLNKKGLTKEEFDRLVATANRAAEIAKSRGLLLVLENSAEPLRGDGRNSWGLSEFYEAANLDVGWQFDTANFFSVCRVPAKPEEVLKFLVRYASRMRYIHLKSSLDGQAQSTLMANPLSFEDVFQVLAKSNVPNIAIELSAVKESDQVKQNVATSVKYLLEAGHIAKA